MNEVAVEESVSLEARLGHVADEFLDRVQRGEEPQIEEYVQRFPALAPVLRQVLPALQVLQQTGPAPAEAPVGLEPGVVGCLGDFRLLREIGRGGMGIVYEAEQISLGRRVALKVLPFAATLDHRQLQRFKNEAQAAAHLQHQNIVPVYFVGCERGVHYYAMQFIEGQTVAALIRELPHDAFAPADKAGPAAPGAEPTSPYAPPSAARERSVAEATPPAATLTTEGSARQPGYFRGVARLGVQAAEALEHAHSQDVVHRDIKPANLLVDVRGNLWVTDFGLAHFQTDASLTLTGDLLGTVRYMSPEQALAKRVLVDHRTDIYSLGASLYEMLTLQPTFTGHDRHELLRQIAFEEPRPPRRINDAIPPDLETIVLKAMEKNPADRYATAQELADDLERYLKDEPIRAKRSSLLQRARKLARRHKPVVTAGIVAALVVLGMAVLALAVSYAQINAEQKLTQKALDGEKQANEELRNAIAREERSLTFQRIARADRELEANNIGRAEELLTECPEQLRGWEWHYLKRRALEPPTVILAAKSWIVDLAYSPDGRYLATASLGFLFQGEYKLWDAATGKQVHTLRGHNALPRTIVFSPDGSQLAAGGASNSVILWDVATGKEVRKLKGHDGWVPSVAYSPDGRHLASASEDGTARIWNVSTGMEVLRFQGHHDSVQCLTYSPDGRQIASWGLDFDVRVWDAATGHERLRLPGHSGRVFNLHFHKDGRYLVSAGADGMRMWDLQTGEMKAIKGINSACLRAVFSPDGERLVSAMWDNTVQVWDWRSAQEVLALRGHTDMVMALTFRSDGRRLASAGLDGTVRLWNATPLIEDPPGKSRRLQGNHKGQCGVVFSPDQRYLLTASMDGTAKLWEVVSGKLIHTLDGLDTTYPSAAFQSGGNLLTTVTVDGTMVQWDVATGQRRRTWRGHVGPVLNAGFIVAFSADGEQFASLTKDGSIGIWETLSGKEVARLPAAFPPYFTVTLSPDARYLAAATPLGSVQVMEVKSGKTVATLPAVVHMCHYMAFSPNGERLAAAYWDGTVKVWDIKSATTLHTFRHGDRATGVAFHPNGRQLASCSCDNTAKVWNLDTGQELETLRGHIGYVMGLAYSPDGQILATASGNRYSGEVQLWETASFGKKN